MAFFTAQHANKDAEYWSGAASSLFSGYPPVQYTESGGSQRSGPPSVSSLSSQSSAGEGDWTGGPPSSPNTRPSRSESIVSQLSYPSGTGPSYSASPTAPKTVPNSSSSSSIPIPAASASWTDLPRPPAGLLNLKLGGAEAEVKGEAGDDGDDQQSPFSVSLLSLLDEPSSSSSVLPSFKPLSFPPQHVFDSGNSQPQPQSQQPRSPSHSHNYASNYSTLSYHRHPDNTAYQSGRSPHHNTLYGEQGGGKQAWHTQSPRSSASYNPHATPYSPSSVSSHHYGVAPRQHGYVAPSTAQQQPNCHQPRPVSPSPEYTYATLNGERVLIVKNPPPPTMQDAKHVPYGAAHPPEAVANRDLLQTYKSHITSVQPHYHGAHPPNAGKQPKGSMQLPAQATLYFPYSRIRPDLLRFALDQHGSRLIQHHLDSPTRQLLSSITDDVTPHLHSLSTDVFGNYIVQKILSLSSVLPTKLESFVVDNAIELSRDQYGCRVVQAALIHPTVLNSVAAEIAHKCEMLAMIKDVNGNHVVQKIVQQGGCAAVAPFVEADALTLAKDQYGCRVLQRMIEVGWGNDVSWDVKGCLDHQFGNYIIQHLLSYGRPDVKDFIFSAVAELGLLALCRRKYSSNVVEKLLMHGSSRHVAYITSYLCHSAEVGQPPACAILVTDPFGNYVVKKAIEAEGGEKVAMVLKGRADEFRGNAYAKRVVAKVEKGRR